MPKYTVVGGVDLDSGSHLSRFAQVYEAADVAEAIELCRDDVLPFSIEVAGVIEGEVVFVDSGVNGDDNF